MVARLGADLVVDARPASGRGFGVVFVDAVEVTGPGGGVEELLGLGGGPVLDVVVAGAGVSGKGDTRDAVLFALGFEDALDHLDFLSVGLLKEGDIFRGLDGALVVEIGTVFATVGFAVTHHGDEATFDEGLVGIRIRLVGSTAPLTGNV